MKTSIVFQITLNREEAEALLKLLGDHSDQDKEKHGLTPKESAIVSEIYNDVVMFIPGAN